MEPLRFTDSGPRLGSSPLRNEFNTGEIEKFINDRAINVLWEVAFLCTCRSSMTGAPDSSCKICRGRGVGYLPAKKELIAIQSQDRSVSNVDLGLFDSGTAIGTTMIDANITFRDRITLPEVSINQSMIFDVTQRRVAQGMYLSYDVKKITLALGDGAEMLLEGEDYIMDYENNLFYPKEHLLAQNVSLNIETILRYVVIDLLKENRYQYTKKGTAQEQFESLPKKLLLKREDAWVNPTPFSMNDDVKTDVNGVTTEDPKREMNPGGFFGGGLIG